ncbi:hypothetical protein D3C76_830860 [compost metagenome]
MTRILSITCCRTSICRTSDLLKIFIVHTITEVITHLLRFIQINFIVISQFLSPVHCLYCPCIGICSICVTPLCGRHVCFFCEQTHEAFVCLSERFVILRRVRDRFPNGLLFTPLECIHISGCMRRIQQVAEAVPVVHVYQPVHQVGLVVAIRRLQFSI